MIYMPPGTDCPMAATKRIAHFDVEFAPCDCVTHEWDRCRIPCIEVQQRLVRVQVKSCVSLWSYARVCENCLTSWMTTPVLVYSPDGQPDYVNEALHDWQPPTN